MTKPRKLYWDTTCFICFLNKDENSRRLICEDILRNAKLGYVEIWTSVFTIAEVIRPRRPKPLVPGLPDWANKIIKDVPACKGHLEEIWQHYYRTTAPYEKLPSEQITQIEGMFLWKWLRKINLDERISRKAVELCRDYDLRPGDAIHAASAILVKVDVLQRWDKDYDKIKNLIKVEDPQPLSEQQWLIQDAPKSIGPHPDDFQSKAAQK